VKLQRTYQDRKGNTFEVEVEIDLDGAAFEREILRLANKAQLSRKGRAGAFGGVIRVKVAPYVASHDESGARR